MVATAPAPRLPQLSPAPRASAWHQALVGAGFCVALALGHSAALALTLGLALALTVGNPWRAEGAKLAPKLLRGGVVLLGFGMDLPQVLAVGLDGLSITLLTLVATLGIGAWLGRRLKVGGRTSTLISVGTAICGGSAIAAMAPVIAAVEGEIAIAIGTVFLLNAAALYVFPWLGQALSLDAGQFGTWTGIAIHDLSSVVGASSQFGVEALQVATAVKLSRTLWIVPIALAAAWWLRTPGTEPDDAGTAASSSRPRPRLPLFIVGFLLASLSRAVLPGVPLIAPALTEVARALLSGALFLIGAGLSASALRKVGWRPLLQGSLLWGVISVTSLGLVLLDG